MACRAREQERLANTARRIFARTDPYVTDSITARARARDAARAARYAIGFAQAGNCASAIQALRHARRLHRAAVNIDALEARGAYRRGPRPND